MGIVRELLLVKGERKIEKLVVLFDSGVARSLIRSDVAKEFTAPKELPISIEVAVANGHRVSSKKLL